MKNIIFECIKCKERYKSPDWNGCSKKKCDGNEFQTIFLE